MTVDKNEITNVVELAIKNGYIHVDTALAYDNEKGVGEAIRNSGIAREEIFVTSKIPAEMKSYDDAKQAFETSFNNLGLDYIDLMLIHAPRPWREMFSKTDKKYYEENIAVWKLLEEKYNEGLVKSIGISNFSIDDTQNIIDNCEIVPMVNQVKLHIGDSKPELLAYCKEHNIIVEAYSPIATGRLLNNQEVLAIAEKLSKSIPQICIRYVLQKNTVALPKTVHEKYMIQNADVDFVISKEDIKILDNIELL